MKELVLALDSTIEGDATSLYLKREVEALDIPFHASRLGFRLAVH